MSKSKLLLAVALAASVFTWPGLAAADMDALYP